MALDPTPSPTEQKSAAARLDFRVSAQFCTFLGLVLLKEMDRCLRAAGLDLEHNEVMRDLKALQRMRIEDEEKVFWLRSQVQGCCAKVFSAVGVALPPLLTLEPEGKPSQNGAGVKSI